MQTCTLYSAESCRAAPSRSDARRLCSRLGSEPPAAARQAERVPRAPGACSGAKPTGHLATAARQLSLPSGWFPEKHSGHPGSEPGCARGGGGEIKPGMGTRGGEAGGVSQAHRSPEPGPGAGHGLHHRPTPSGKGPAMPPRSAPLGLWPALPSPAARAGDVLGRPTASPACWHEPGSEGGRWTPPGKGVSRVGLGEPCQPASPASIHSTVPGAEQVAHSCLRYLWDRPSGALKDLADH